MKHIAILIPTLKKGGAEKQAIILMNALGEAGHKVYFVLFYPELGIEPDTLKLISAIDYKIVKLTGNIFTRSYKLYSLLKSEHVDSFFCYLTMPNFIGSIVGRMAGVRQTFTGIRCNWAPKWKLMIEIMASWISTGVIANCYSGVDFFSNRGVKRMITIPNCFIYPSEFFYRQRKDCISIITVARFDVLKDYETAIRSVAFLRVLYSNITFEIVGKYYDVTEDTIRGWLKQYNIEDITHLHIHNQDIPTLLDNADIYLSSSLHEGTSNSIMEALNASLPVIATNVGDNSILVKHGKNGFIVPVKSPEKIAEALKKLCDSYEMRLEMGKIGNEHLRDFYSFEKFKNSYYTLIND